MTLHIKRNGTAWQSATWVRTKNLFVNINGAWTPVKKVFINRFGQWKLVEPTTGSTEFTSAGTTYQFEVPPFVRTISITACAGGGGGGGISDDPPDPTRGGGGGGSSGQMIRGYQLSVIPGSSIQITVGKGGVGSSYTASNGTNTVIGSIVLKGGQGGRGGKPGIGGTFDGGTVPTGGPTGYFGYNGSRASGFWGGNGGVGLFGGGGGLGGTGYHDPNHGQVYSYNPIEGTNYGQWRSGSNATQVGAGGGGGGSSDIDSGGYTSGGTGGNGYVHISW